MALYDKWLEFAEKKNGSPDAKEFWGDYFLKEKSMYEQILARKTAISGTVTELAKKFDIDTILMMGFIDGINDSLKRPNKLEEIEEDTKILLSYDKEKLFYNMVAAKANWLFELPQWNELLSEEKRKEIYKEQRKSLTVVNENKVGRNEPCPCGSGKKYKKCCGK